MATTWGRLSSGPDCATSGLPREGTGTGTLNSIGRSPGEEEDNQSSGAALLLAYGAPRRGEVLQELCCMPELEPWTYPQSTNDSSPEPFKRIAMDIVGPLPRSRAGNHYVLVICDYATRYPEAVPLCSIDAEHVAEELVKLFSRVGIPREILTDQGTNFTSQLLAEVYRLLHVHALHTNPYHPQTDGLVERFNQTLKSMLRKHATKEEKDWDRLLPYVLFAYHEVPQASTGFSPFELLYVGHWIYYARRGKSVRRAVRASSHTCST